MDDDVRRGMRHGGRDLVGVEGVREHRHGAQLVEHRLLGLVPGHAVNLMAGGNQARDQLPPDCPGCSCDEHSHR